MGQTRRLRRTPGRSPYSQGQAGWRWTLVWDRLRSAAQAELCDQCSRHRQAHDHEGMRDGRVRVSKHGLESDALISAQRMASGTLADHPRQLTNNSPPAAASVAIATR